MWRQLKGWDGEGGQFVQAAQTQDHRIMLEYKFLCCWQRNPQHLLAMPGLCFSNSSQKHLFSENTNLEYTANRKQKHTGDGDCATKTLPVFSFPTS